MLADESTDDEVLSKITYVGGSISIAGLLVTMATIILYKYAQIYIVKVLKLKLVVIILLFTKQKLRFWALRI